MPWDARRVRRWQLSREQAEVIDRSDIENGFEVLPRRRVVERTFAWLGRCRRLAKDWEKSLESSTAWTLIVRIRLMTQRHARHCHVSWTWPCLKIVLVMRPSVDPTRLRRAPVRCEIADIATCGAKFGDQGPLRLTSDRLLETHSVLAPYQS